MAKLAAMHRSAACVAKITAQPITFTSTNGPGFVGNPSVPIYLFVFLNFACLNIFVEYKVEFIKFSLIPYFYCKKHALKNVHRHLMIKKLALSNQLIFFC